MKAQRLAPDNCISLRYNGQIQVNEKDRTWIWLLECYNDHINFGLNWGWRRKVRGGKSRFFDTIRQNNKNDGGEKNAQEQDQSEGSK